MTTRPWMPLYIGDYLADTTHLGALQSGAYLHLIMHYWQHGGLPVDENAIMRIARLTPLEWRRERATLAAFFHDGWKHKRIDEELAHAADVSSKRRASALQKRNKSSAIPPAIAEQLDTHARTSAGASQSQSQPQKEQQHTSARENDELELPVHLDRRTYTEEFEKLWDEYRPIAPKNATKADASRAFERLSVADKAACQRGLAAYVRWLQVERGKRSDTPAKHLATFINKRGWEPFLEASAPGNGNGHASPAVDEFGDRINWPKRAEYLKRTGEWPERWGPRDQVPAEFAGLFANAVSEPVR